MRLVTAVAILAIGVSMTSAEAQQQETLRIMSFNVRYGTADDGDNAWEQRKDILVNTIREYAPDIVGTQECLDFQADYVCQQLPEYAWFGMGREFNGTGERMAILYRREVLSPIETGNFWLSEDPGRPGSRAWETACPRMTTWARFYHHRARAFFRFFNTHLDHRSEPARVNGSKLLLERVRAVDPAECVIVTGDFNAVAGTSESWQVLVGDHLKDAWDAAAERVGPPLTWSAFSAPVEGVDRRIDWILFRGALTALKCETVLYNEAGRYPSDHYPVFAEFAWNPAP